MAGLSAIKENDLKKIIALSTLSNLGIIIRIARLGFIKLAFFHLVVHALFKALLFIRAGYLIDICHHRQDLRFMGNIFSRFPLISVSFMVANGALCGLPFLAGFYSKDLLLERGFFFFSSFLIIVVYYLGLFLTVLYSFRVIKIRLFSRRRFSPLTYRRQQDMKFYVPIIGLRVLRIRVGAFLSRKIRDMQGEVWLDKIRKLLIMGVIILVITKAILKFSERIFFSKLKIFRRKVKEIHRNLQHVYRLRFRSLFFLRKIRGQLILPFLNIFGKKIFSRAENG